MTCGVEKTIRVRWRRACARGRVVFVVRMMHSHAPCRQLWCPFPVEAGFEAAPTAPVDARDPVPIDPGELHRLLHLHRDLQPAGDEDTVEEVSGCG